MCSVLFLIILNAYIIIFLNSFEKKIKKYFMKTPYFLFFRINK